MLYVPKATTFRTHTGIYIFTFATKCKLYRPGLGGNMYEFTAIQMEMQYVINSEIIVMSASVEKSAN